MSTYRLMQGIILMFVVGSLVGALSIARDLRVINAKVTQIVVAVDKLEKR